jgi:hypothetical protein
MKAHIIKDGSFNVSQVSSVKRWWKKIQACVPKVQRNDTVKLASYIVWNILKSEDNRCSKVKR